MSEISVPVREIAARLTEHSTRAFDGVHERVVMFEHSGEQLLSVRLRPDGMPRPTALVVCPSFFELTTLQRSEMDLARRAAAQGYAAIYAEPPGVGDSSGAPEQCTLSVRVAAALAAFDELRLEVAEVESPCFVGARLGAVVATLAAKQSDGPASVAMWDPALDADTYWKQARRMARIAAVIERYRGFEDPEKQLARSDATSVLGHVVTRELVSDFAAIEEAFANSEPVDGPAFVVALTKESLDAAVAKLSPSFADVQGEDLALSNRWHLGVSEAPEAIPPTLTWMQERLA